MPDEEIGDGRAPVAQANIARNLPALREPSAAWPRPSRDEDDIIFCFTERAHARIERAQAPSQNGRFRWKDATTKPRTARRWLIRAKKLSLEKLADPAPAAGKDVAARQRGALDPHQLATLAPHHRKEHPGRGH